MTETNHDDVSEGAHLPSLAGVRADAAVRGRGRPEEPHQLRHGPKHFQEPAEGNHLSCYPRIIFIMSMVNGKFSALFRASAPRCPRCRGWWRTSMTRPPTSRPTVSPSPGRSSSG